MKANTRIFGNIDIEDDKIITLEKGMIGFPDLQRFALIFNKDKENPRETIMWFQSMDEGDVAFPVIIPNIIKPDYAPDINDELIAPLGGLNGENTYILVTVTVPSEIEKITCNLHAPIIINMDNKKGAQVITENDFPIKYPIYDMLKAGKAGE